MNHRLQSVMPLDLGPAPQIAPIQMPPPVDLSPVMAAMAQQAARSPSGAVDATASQQPILMPAPQLPMVSSNNAAATAVLGLGALAAGIAGALATPNQNPPPNAPKEAKQPQAPAFSSQSAEAPKQPVASQAVPPQPAKAPENPPSPPPPPAKVAAPLPPQKPVSPVKPPVKQPPVKPAAAPVKPNPVAPKAIPGAPAKQPPKQPVQKVDAEFDPDSGSYEVNKA